MNIPNYITLEALKHMPVGEIAGLPAAELARLQQETTKALRSAKMACDWLDGALALKYADQADGLRRTAQKDTGTVRFADGEITVKADLPKRVAWDQAQLAQMVERIRAAGDDPAEIIDISYTQFTPKLSGFGVNWVYHCYGHSFFRINGSTNAKCQRIYPS